MATNSKIEWTDCTWNPTTGCTPVSPGCLNCYAATFSHRGLSESHRGLTVLRDGRAVFSGTVKLHEERLAEPLKWKKPRRVFVDSMSDLFHEKVPFDFVDRVFAVMALCPQHTFQVLTKRPERMAEYASDPGRLTMVAQIAARDGFGEASMGFRWPLPNVWLGTSIENQQTADERIPHLLKVPAAVLFLSYEPALGPVDLEKAGAIFPGVCGCTEEAGRKPCKKCGDTEAVSAIDLVICGGESGHGARPFNLQWARDLRDQCKAAGVPYFQKQLGSDAYTDHACTCGHNVDGHWKGPSACSMCDGRLRLKNHKGGDPSEWPDDLRVREFPEVPR